MQEQIKTLFARVLDLDSSGKEPVQKKMVDYYNAKGGDRLNTFQFQPQPMSFEVIDRKTFTEVLYPKNIYDMIDYFVREFVKQEQSVRICKNCKRYFALSGRSDAEYCNRPIDDKGRTYKDMGAINLWNGQKGKAGARCTSFSFIYSTQSVLFISVSQHVLLPACFRHHDKLPLALHVRVRSASRESISTPNLLLLKEADA